jgi:hypothetical protein
MAMLSDVGNSQASSSGVGRRFAIPNSGHHVLTVDRQQQQADRTIGER